MAFQGCKNEWAFGRNGIGYIDFASPLPHKEVDEFCMF